MTLVAGVDSSTQSTKVVVCDADTGEVRPRRAAPRTPTAPRSTRRLWWEAFEQAERGGCWTGSPRSASAGSSTGMVCLDEAGEVVRPALLWNDTRSARAAVDLVAELGGPAGLGRRGRARCRSASFTVTKLRWLARARAGARGPDRRGAAAARLADPRGCARAAAAPTTDRGDASGTGYWSPATGEYRRDLLRLAFGRDLALPRVAGPGRGRSARPRPARCSSAGHRRQHGRGARPRPAPRRRGGVARHLGARVRGERRADRRRERPRRRLRRRDRPVPAAGVHAQRGPGARRTVADLLGVDLAEFDELALSAPPGAGGLTLLPYLDGERTPNLPDARGLLAGLTRANASAANLARAAVEGMLVRARRRPRRAAARASPVERVLLIGGAARSARGAARSRRRCSARR